MINSCFFVILTGGCLSKTEIKPFDGEASKSALAILGSWTLDRLRFEAQGFSLVDEKTEAENSVIKIEMDHLTVSSYCISPEDKLIQIPLEISVPVTVTEKIVKTLANAEKSVKAGSSLCSGTINIGSFNYFIDKDELVIGLDEFANVSPARTTVPMKIDDGGLIAPGAAPQFPPETKTFFIFKRKK